MAFVAFISDLHIPFQDDRALKIAFKILNDFPPDILVWGGDIGDYYAISRFDKIPRVGMDLQKEFHLQRELFHKARQILPKAKMYFLDGNHEDRYDRYLIQNALQIFGLPHTSLKEQLCLRTHRIEYVKSGIIEIDGIKHMHGHLVRQASGATARAHADRHGPVIHGHAHRAGKFYRTDGRSNGLLVGIENPCLCDLNPEYVKEPNWQQGFTYITGRGPKAAIRHGIEQVIIEDGAAVFRGEYYRC